MGEIQKHLNVIHSSREAFIKRKMDEKICRGLCHLIRATEESFNLGDTVFHK